MDIRGVLSVLVLVVSSGVGSVKRSTHDKIFINLPPVLMCFRRLNGTSQVGCGSDVAGNVGVIFVIDSDLDRQRLLSGELQDDPYMVVLRAENVSSSLLLDLEASGKVNGVIVTIDDPNYDTERGTVPQSEFQLGAPFSADEACPNQQFTLYNESNPLRCQPNNNPWNPVGLSALGLRDWKFPLLLLDKNDSIETLQKCYAQFNAPDAVSGEPKPHPLCAMEILSKMFAAVDAVTCLRRSRLIPSRAIFSTARFLSFCEPLGEYNLHAPLVPRAQPPAGANQSEIDANEPFSSQPYANRSVTVVAARLDTFSLFDQFAPGAGSVVSGLAAFLVAFDALSAHREDFAAHDQESVHFMLLNGESAGYIGSSRILYDMEQGEFPSPREEDPAQWWALGMRKEHVKRWIELHQVSPDASGEGGAIFLHADPGSVDSEVDNMRRTIAQAAAQLGLSANSTPRDTPLPPSSLHHVLGRDAAIRGVLVTNHRRQYGNDFYNSFKEQGISLGYDCAASLVERRPLAAHLANVGAAVAASVYRLVLGRDIEKIESLRNVQLASDVLFCYLCSSNCSLFQNVSSKELRSALSARPYPLYVSVRREGGATPMGNVRLLTHRVMAELSGRRVGGVSQAECRNRAQGNDSAVFAYHWVDLETSSEATNETSGGYCLKSAVKTHIAESPAFAIEDYDLADPRGPYSTWTESVWATPEARLFLKPSRKQEVLTLVLGLVVSLLTLFLALLIRSKHDVIFLPLANGQATANSTSSPTAPAI